ncbi:MAG: hypothetical protein IKN20_02105 [Firmicutes bacterium]|nr:hypothetical protein [Bacillota bacterium]
MKGYDLLKGMGHIDDDLVAEALEAEAAAVPQERKVVRLSRFAGWSAARRWGTAAAAVAVLCLAGLGVFGGMGQSAKDAVPAEAPMLGMSQTTEEKNAALGSGMEIAEAVPESAEEESAMEMAEEPAIESEADEAAPAETEPLPAEAAAGVEIPASESYAYAGMDEDAYNGKTLVSGYPDAPEGCYASPKNGEVGYSEPLRAAMKEYGDEVVYRVFVDLFADEKQLALADPEEAAALLQEVAGGQNITTAIETYTDADGTDHVYPTMHATYEQLQNFEADDAHGWMLFLYDERVK